jgi:hypothetical protein
VSALGIFALGTNLFPYLWPHYLAAAACLFVLLAIVGLERLSTIHVREFAVGAEAVKIIALVCLTHFFVWYGSHLLEGSAVSKALELYETWDSINHGDPHGRKALDRQLAAIPGKLVILVQYSPRHLFQNEWVWNAADIDDSRVVWARDLGPTDNANLRAYYPDRTFLLLQPDVRPPELARYSPR